MLFLLRSSEPVKSGFKGSDPGSKTLRLALCPARANEGGDGQDDDQPDKAENNEYDQSFHVRGSGDRENPLHCRLQNRSWLVVHPWCLWSIVIARRIPADSYSSAECPGQSSSIIGRSSVACLNSPERSLRLLDGTGIAGPPRPC